MKLFGGAKSIKAVRGDRELTTNERRIIHVRKTIKKASTGAVYGEKNRALKIALWSAAVVVFLAAAISLGIRLGGPSTGADAEPDFSVSVEDTEKSDEVPAENESTAIVLPLSPVPPDMTAETEGSAEPVFNEPEENVRNNNCYTFLLAAYDIRGISVDTIMVGKLDVAEATLNVVSIPRDTLVNVSWALKKINTIMVYEDGEPMRFVNELSSILGFPIDYYAFIDGSTVEKMVDAMGGVYYTVPRNMNYDDPALNLHINVPAGYQYLNGSKAVQVLRFRVGHGNTGYSNGDLGRIETQQDFLRSLLCQLLDKGEIPNLEEVINIFIENSTGNLDEDKLELFAAEFMKLDEQDIRFATAPGKNIGIKNISYYEISAVEWTELINKYLNPYSQEVALHNLDVLMYDSAERSVMSTSGEMLDYDSFY